MIPVLNEEEAIGGVIACIPRDVVSEIIVADGGSTDRTIEVASAHGARVLKAGKGYGRACLAGALAADEACSIVVTMDGDGSDAPEEIPVLIAPILAGDLRFRDRLSRSRRSRARFDGVASTGLGLAHRRGHRPRLWLPLH